MNFQSNFSAPFVRRPVATSLVTIAILLSGAIAFRFLPVAPLPQVDLPTIGVGAGLPGASPETMASSVATPLERQFGRIAGVTQMTSSSTLGSTGITLQFDLNRDINAAARDVEAAINAARSQLPADMPSQPSYRKVNSADSPYSCFPLPPTRFRVGQLYDACRFHPGAEDCAGGRRRPSVHLGLFAPRRSRTSESTTAEQLWHQPGDRAQGTASRRIPIWPKAHFRIMTGPGRSPIPISCSKPTSTNPDCSRASGCPRTPGRRRHGHRLRRRHSQSGPNEWQARRDHCHLSPARREHDRDRGPGESHSPLVACFDFSGAES